MSFCHQTPQMALLSGNVPGQVGSYDECLQLNQSKFCLALSHSVTQRRLLGLCIPKTCQSSSVLEFLSTSSRLNNTFYSCGANYTMDVDYPNTNCTQVFCSDYDARMGWYGYLALSLLVLIAAVVLLATFFDYWLSVSVGANANAAASPGPGGLQSLHNSSVVDLQTNNSYGSQGSPGTASSDGKDKFAIQRRRQRDRLIVAFSLIEAFRRWRQFVAGEATNVFNAIRVLSWGWLCIVDVYSYTQQIPSFETKVKEDTNLLYSLLQRRAAASFGIGTFLFLSGFASAKSLFAEQNSRRADVENLLSAAPSQSLYQRCRCGVIPWFVGYLLQRWIRLVPLYGTVLLITHSTIATLGSGPFWATFVESPSMSSNCGKYWWTNLLFINNLYPGPSHRCFPWSYYFALDFQFYLIAPFFMWLYREFSIRVFSVVIGVISALSLMSRGWTYYGALGSNTNAGVGYFNFPENTFPWAMVVPFIGGVLLFIFYHEMREREFEDRMFVAQEIKIGAQRGAAIEKLSQLTMAKMKKKGFRILCIWGGVFLCTVLVVVDWFIETNRLKNRKGSLRAIGATVFASIDVLLWVLGTVGILLPMLLEYGGIFRRFLCHRLWCGLSRLVFAAYLVHPVVIILYNAIRVSPAVMGFLPFLYESCGNIILSLLIGFFFHLAIEQPAVQLTTTPSSAS